MTFPQVLEVAIGLVLLYYVLGSVVSALTQLMMDVQEARGSAMEMSLSRVFGNDISNILNFPQIRSLQPVKYNNLTGIFTGNTERKKVEKNTRPDAGKCLI